MPGEVLELLAEVGLVEVARGLGELGPVDRMQGVDGEDQSREAVDPRHSLRGDSEVGLELSGQMVTADPGAVGQRPDRDRTPGGLQAPGRLGDQLEAARRCRDKPRSQLILENLQDLAARRGTGDLIAHPVQRPFPHRVDWHPSVPQLRRRHVHER